MKFDRLSNICACELMKQVNIVRRTPGSHPGASSLSPLDAVPPVQPPSLSLSFVLSACPGCPPLLHCPGSFFRVALGAPHRHVHTYAHARAHTQTQSMHFRQGANGKINYQQAKALALHFCWREKRDTDDARKEEVEEGEAVGLVKRWRE